MLEAQEMTRVMLSVLSDIQLWRGIWSGGGKGADTASAAMSQH